MIRIPTRLLIFSLIFAVLLYEGVESKRGQYFFAIFRNAQHKMDTKAAHTREVIWSLFMIVLEERFIV